MINLIKHKTVFDFEATPRSVVQRLHLAPCSSLNQKVINWQIEIDGGKLVIDTFDYHGNKLHLCINDPNVKSMEIRCSGEIDVTDNNGIFGAHDSNLPIDLYKNHTALSKPGPRLRELSKKIKESIPIRQNGGLDILHELSTRILESIKYSKGKTDINTTAEIAMEIGAGVCQDHTHAFITSARLLGFSSRYVSGYLSNGINETQVATHAWAEVYIMGLGWVGFDISNGISPDERYVRLATGFDYADVIPISGVRIGNGEEQIKTEITFNQQ